MFPLAVFTLLLESGSGLWSPLMEDLDQNNQLSSDVARVCLSPECKEAAASLLASMNISADPCTDFFEYACGGWVRSHPVPTTDSHWNQFNLVDEQLTLQIKDILESDESKEEPSPVKAARNHYRVCMNSENLVLSEHEEVKPILELLARYGGWPMTSRRWSPKSFHWLNMLADVTRDLGISPIITVYPNVDRKHSNQSVLTVDQPNLVVPRSMLVEPAPYRGQLEAYRLWVFRTAGLLARASGREVPPELLRLQAEEIVNFETKIAKISSPVEMRRSMVRTYNPMSLRELQAWTDLAAPGLVNWMVFFRRLLAGTEVTVDWSERLVVREVDYVFKVVQLVRDTPLKVLANYLHWRVVKSLSSELNGKMKQLAFEFEKVFTGATQEQPRWKECIGSTNSAYGMAIGYVYVQKHFDNDAKKVALEMSENIKRVFSDEISRLSWMDVKTQGAARHKVETMIQLIGYPVWLHNTSALEHYFHGMKTGDVHFDNVIESRRHIGYRILNKLRDSISRDEWPIPAAVVNAYYNPQANSITHIKKLTRTFHEGLPACSGAVHYSLGQPVARRLYLYQDFLF